MFMQQNPLLDEAAKKDDIDLPNCAADVPISQSSQNSFRMHHKNKRSHPGGTCACRPLGNPKRNRISIQNNNSTEPLWSGDRDEVVDRFDPQNASYTMLMMSDFYKEIAILLECISELCSCQTCSEWEAIDFFMDWTDTQLSNDSLFASSGGAERQATMKGIVQGFLRIYGHVYHSHYSQFRDLTAHAHLNTCCRRFILFVGMNNLAESAELQQYQQGILQCSYPFTGWWVAMVDVDVDDRTKRSVPNAKSQQIIRRCELKVGKNADEGG